MSAVKRLGKKSLRNILYFLMLFELDFREKIEKKKNNREN